jgi:quinol monooxygenase YgiN
MLDESIIIVATIIARSDAVEQLKSILRGLIGSSSVERGCISYRLLQNNADPANFTFIEEWENDAAIEAHFAMPHLQDALAKAASLFATAPDVRKFSAVPAIPTASKMDTR